jgi:hypothetical protein
MAKSRRRPTSDPSKAASALETLYRELHKEYWAFVESIQEFDPRGKAEAWISYTANHIETYGDQEALVYLRSREHECKHQIQEVISNWKTAAQEEIQQSARGISVTFIETGKTKRHGGMPLAAARDVANISPYRLPNFWGWRDEEEFYIDATMLRTVEWCEIGGFEQWWERLARLTTQDIFQVGIDPLPASYWLFSMCRSNYAIELMGKALAHALEAIVIPQYDVDRPWRILRETGSTKKKKALR